MPALNPTMFPFQSDIVAWALRRGRAAVFAGCGLGKTLMRLEWARVVSEQKRGAVLIMAPRWRSRNRPNARRASSALGAVSARDGNDGGIIVTNYEMFGALRSRAVCGVVLDESSILKAYDGSNSYRDHGCVPRYAVSSCVHRHASPERFHGLGNHSEFLGVLTRAEMLATFFVHDGGETQNWRLKGHAARLLEVVGVVVGDAPPSRRLGLRR